jgi:hypothetical protein
MNNQVEDPLNEALRSTEEALSRVTTLAIQRIRSGAENSPHLEAGELRNALRQLAALRRERPRAG